MNEEQDSLTRINEFKRRLFELHTELKVDFAHIPLWEPIGDGSFKLRIQTEFYDTKGRAVRSPFQ